MSFRNILEIFFLPPPFLCLLFGATLSIMVLQSGIAAAILGAVRRLPLFLQEIHEAKTEGSGHDPRGRAR
jgi:hypothetical protein